MFVKLIYHSRQR